MPDPIWVALEEFNWKPTEIAWNQRKRGLRHKFADDKGKVLLKETKSNKKGKPVPRHKILYPHNKQLHYNIRNKSQRHQDVL